MPAATAAQIVSTFRAAGQPDDPSPAGWDGYIELGQPAGPGGPGAAPDRAVHRERERGTTRINNQTVIASRGTIANQIDVRINGQRFPDQAQTNLCGPAAFFFCLLQDRPDIYAQFVIDLWTDGRAKLGSLEIAPPLTLRQNTRAAVQGNYMDAVDWMTLGSLRAQDAAYTHPDTQIAAITTPGPFQAWFQAVGGRPGFSNARIAGRARWRDVLDIAWHQGRAWVLLFIKAHAMEKGAPRARSGSPTTGWCSRSRSGSTTHS